MTENYKGLVYVKHGRVGSRSEGPDYYLQTTRGDYLLHLTNRHPWQPDYQLEFYSRRMVEIEGTLQTPQMIEVKSIREILTAQLPPMKSERPHLGEPTQLGLGQTIKFEEGVSISFLAVAQDSRCPPGVLCPWEGLAVVRLRIQKAASDEVDFSLTLRGGHPEQAETRVSGYKVVAHNLEPASHPAAGSTEQYVLTLSVTALPNS